MTEKDLTTIVREHVSHDEPPFLLDAATVVRRGRRRLRLRRAGAVVGSAAALAVAAAVVVPLAGAGDGSAQVVVPATQRALDHYDARKMPKLLDEQARAVLSRSVADLGAVDFTAEDSQDQVLPAKYYDKASSMSVSYGGDSEHRYGVTLAHSASEAEGSAKRICASMLGAGYDLSCTVTTTPDGSVVTTTVAAKRRVMGDEWGAVNRKEIRTGKTVEGDPSHRPVTPDQLWFDRRVKAVHSGTFVSYVTETVKAPSLAAAQRMFTVPVGDLQELATDPVLVIPKPPLLSNGCPWELHPQNSGCGVTAP